MKKRIRMTKDKGLILLSGGLDSLVALWYTKETVSCDLKLALTFDYGQRM